MLKALFFRKRTAITYKSRIESPVFSNFDTSPYALPPDNQFSQPYTGSSSRLTHEQTVINRDNVYNNAEKVRKEQPSAKKEVQVIDSNPIEGTSVESSSIIAPEGEVSTNIPENKDAVAQPEVSFQQTSEKAKKRKRPEQPAQDPFSIFDYLESDSDGTVALMKAKPVGSLRKTNLDTYRKAASNHEPLAAAKEKSSKKLVNRLKAESNVVVHHGDETQSELSDFEPFIDNDLSELSYVIAAEHGSPASDPREAELSSFMRQEFGVETGNDEPTEEQQRKPSKRKQYVPQNKIKARFTYGSARKIVSSQNETTSESKIANSTTNTLSSNDAPISLNNTLLDRSKSLGDINTSQFITSTLSSPITSNHDMQVDEQNGASENDLSQTISQTTQENVTNIFSAAENLAILVTWLSNIHPIICTTSISQKSAAGKMGDNVVAAQTLVAYLARNPEGLNHMEHVIGNNDMVKVLSGNIESCLDAFAEVDTLSSNNETLQAILSHGLNCLIIMESFTASTHCLTSLPGLCDTLLQMLAVFQECTAHTIDEVSGLACSGVYTTLQQLVSITCENPAQCHTMTHQLALFDSIASTNCRTAMNIQGSWKDHFDRIVLSSEFFLPFHTAILALGIMVNLFEGDQNAAPQYSSLVAIPCQNIGPCIQVCTCYEKMPSSTWMLDAFKSLSSEEVAYCQNLHSPYCICR
ncbi:unnamed protein product [Umbelopsis ramanniana]